ncbi:MAG: uroporphyrinogen-III C-methyltransferase [Pseudomonadota bacterium]
MNKTPDDPDLAADSDDTSDNTLPEVRPDDASLTEEPGVENAADGEPADSDTAGHTEQKSGKPARLTGLFAAAGLLLGGVALLGVAYLFITREAVPELDFARPAEVRDLSGQVDGLGESLDALEARLGTLATGVETARESREDLEEQLQRAVGELENRLGAYESLPPRVGNLENSIAAIQGIEAGARDTLLLAEAEYYLQIANSLLGLAGNVELAKVALGMANDRLTSIGNPALNNVRQAVTDELTALELTERPDRESNAMLLSSLARLVDSLPLQPVNGDTDSVDPSAAEEETGMAGRAWNGVKQAFSGAVKVTRPGNDDAPLLMPGTEPLIRSNLSLQLQAARLALLQGEQVLFEQSIDDADNWLLTYFDTGSLQVESARTTLGEIRAAAVTAELPDISESLRLLRQYQSLSEPAP